MFFLTFYFSWPSISLSTAFHSTIIGMDEDAYILCRDKAFRKSDGVYTSSYGSKTGHDHFVSFARTFITRAQQKDESYVILIHIPVNEVLQPLQSMSSRIDTAVTISLICALVVILLSALFERKRISELASGITDPIVVMSTLAGERKYW